MTNGPWKALKWLMFAGLISAVGCAEDTSEPAGNDSSAVDDPMLISADVINAGWPGNENLVNEDKSDQNFPAQFFELQATQSPVKSQGSRGVCSIFSSMAYVEHLYITEGSLPNPDFSEQYLQWSSKFLERAFPNTSGSNNDANLRAVANYGVPEESAWPYETSEWGASNDPDCGASGDDKPTKCFTNGETAPESAESAEKYFIPRPRWQSARVRSIKATMFNKKQAVPVGMTFFYQSWNHSRSELPTNRDYWKQGYVLSPNAKDREISLAKRAGHAILLTGWDDTLEVQKVDGEGNPIFNADGTPDMERGFFLFKNSWGKGSFGSANPQGDGYGWIAYSYVEEFASAVVSDLPEPVVKTEICGDEIDNDSNGDTDCDDAACADQPICNTGGEVIDVEITESAIPDNDPTGLVLPFIVEGQGELTSMAITVDVTHTYRGDLRIELILPSGERQVLERNSSDSGDDIQKRYEIDATGFPGYDIYEIAFIDTAAQDTGVVNSVLVEVER